MSVLVQVLLSAADHTFELDDSSLIERELIEVIDPTVLRLCRHIPA